MPSLLHYFFFSPLDNTSVPLIPEYFNVLHSCQFCRLHPVKTDREISGRKRYRIVGELPRIGRPGSRSAELHAGDTPGTTATTPLRPSIAERNRFELLRIFGMIGTLLIGFGGLGGGALPVVNNPYGAFPFGALMGRMMVTSSSIVLLGVGFLVLAWLVMGSFVGADGGRARVGVPLLLRTFGVWVLPLVFTAPLFTQDIYSYLAQGSIVAQGLDPYSAGPVELLGPENPLARSVPFIWAESPSPYGPVALAISAGISTLTGDSIFWGVVCHRLVSLLGVAAAAWGIVALARRCKVSGPVAVWMGVLNPLVVLHLIGGIHNEAIMMGILLVGLELGLRGIAKLEASTLHGIALIVASGALISCAGMVKVPGFMALGFVGVALARHWGGLRGFVAATLLQTITMVGTIAALTVSTGISLGWVTGQGGAATIRSWLSLSTDVGLAASFFGELLGLGDHSEATLTVARSVALLVAVAFCARMLFATYKGTIDPVGGLGVATLVLVILFPVVHPWYPLWGIMPLAAWANRTFFRAGVAVYSAIFSFLVLPRGLALAPATVTLIYSMALLAAITIGVLVIAWFKLRRPRALH